VSQILQSYVRDTYGREAIYIPNGAEVAPAAGISELARWELAPGQYILFVGRLISDRGLVTLLDAYSSLDERRPLVIAGDVQHDREYVDMLRRHAGPRVVFTGFQSGAALAQLYAHATLCVHPSEVEGLPIAVLEAMSHGRAVLVSDIPENREAIGDCGATFPVRDAAALVAALRGLLADPARLEDLGRRGRERVRVHFDWDRITAATEAVYRRALGREPAGRLETGSNRLREGARN
jgi:glycosyltransferase involved in cell wall biosynthesis